MKLSVPLQIFEKYSFIKFYKNPSNESRAVQCGRTDRHDEANSRFRSFSNAPIIIIIIIIMLFFIKRGITRTGISPYTSTECTPSKLDWKWDKFHPSSVSAML